MIERHYKGSELAALLESYAGRGVGDPGESQGTDRQRQS